MIQNSSATVPTTAPRLDGEFRAGPVSDWLTGEARMVGGPRAQLEGFCRHLLAAGLPLFRASFNLQTLHPQLRAQSFVWDHATNTAKAFDHNRAVDHSPGYLNSPVAAIHHGAGGVRCRLDADPPQLDYPLMHELKAEGVTDYVMMPITFSDGTLNAISWATDRPGGFTTTELGEVYSLLPILALLLEVAVARKVASNVLDTYIGRDAARRVLAGDITRGSGETITAALWYCDMRGFTAMTETLPRDEVLATLNDYFECMVGAVHAQHGSVLKFMGDGMLAIFACGDAPICDAASNALGAAVDALAALDALNVDRVAAGKSALETGLALHLGDVMYGNIGAGDRLDFTVIGPAVNEVARVEQVCREVEQRILLTRAFAEASIDELVSLGTFALRGVALPQELFTLPAGAPTDDQD